MCNNFYSSANCFHEVVSLLIPINEGTDVNWTFLRDTHHYLLSNCLLKSLLNLGILNVKSRYCGQVIYHTSCYSVFLAHFILRIEFILLLSIYLHMRLLYLCLPHPHQEGKSFIKMISGLCLEMFLQCLLLVCPYYLTTV